MTVISSLVTTASKVSQNVSTLIQIAAKESVIEKFGIGGCDKCNKKGMVFLPVRYAVGEINDLGDYALPESKVDKFTDIKLNESLSKSGRRTARSAKSCYILRKLRKGYLYIYDDHPGLPAWICYGVNDNGELTGFPAASPKALDEFNPMDNCIKGDGHPARASLVSLRDPHVSRTVHVMFLEVALDEERLDWIASQPEWREANMQAFEVSSPKSSPYYFSRFEIPKFVPEYDDDRNTYEVLKHQMWQGRYADKVASDIARQLRMDTYEVLGQHMDSVQCVNGGSEGFMFAVKDEAGIIEQLDAQRAYPTAVLRKDMLPGDSKDPSQPANKTLNERNYKWYLAVQQFQAIMQSMKIRDEEVDENYIVPGQKQTYKQVLEELEERKKEIPDVIKRYTKMYYNYENLSEEDQQKVIENKREDYYNYLARKKRSYEREWAVCRRADISKRDSAVEEVGDYYNGDDWDCIDSVVGKYVERIKRDTPIFDDDYSLWVIFHLHKVINRYDENSFMHCGHVASIIADVLQHGVLSPASSWMWDILQNFNDEGKILLRGFTFNMPTVFSDIDEYLAPAEGKSKLEELKSIIKGAQKCYGKFKKAYDKAKSDSLKKAIWDKGDLQTYHEAVQKIAQVHANVATTTWINDLAHSLSKEEAFTNRYAVALNGERRLCTLNEIARSVSQVLSEQGPPLVSVEKYTLTLGELSKLADTVQENLVGAPENKARPIAEHFSNLNRVGGNFSNVDVSSNTKLDFFVIGHRDTIQNLNYSYGKRMSATNSVVDFHDKHQQAFVDLFSSKKKCFDTLSGKVGVVIACVKATKDVINNSRDMDLWWKCISSWLSVFQIITDVASWRYTRLARKEIIKEGANIGKKLLDNTKVRTVLEHDGGLLSERAVRRIGRYVVNSEMCILASKGMTHLITMMSVYDAWKGLVQLADMTRRGALRQDKIALASKIIIDLVSSIIIGLCVTSLFIGAFLSLIIFGITSLFIKKRLVPECIQTWLRRSKFGKEQDTVLGKPFRDMNEEQESLRLLLKGIVVTAIVDNGKIERARASAICELPDAKAFNYTQCKTTGANKIISLDISLPYGTHGIINIDFLTNMEGVNIDRGSTVIASKDGTENGTVAIYKLLEEEKYNHVIENDRDVLEAGGKGECNKNLSLSKGGAVVGDKFIFSDGDGVEYILNTKKIGVDSSVVVKKSDDRLCCSLVRNVFIDERVEKEEAELSIKVFIRGQGQVFNEVFRAKLLLPG